MIRVNLFKPEGKEPRPKKEAPALAPPKIKAKKIPAIVNLAILALIVVIVALFFTQRKGITRERGLLKSAQEEKVKLQDVLSKLEQAEQQKAVLEKKIGLIKRLRSQQEIAVKIIDELSKNLPDWLWLTEASYDSQKILVRGKAISNNLIADYIFNLENSPFLENVNLIASTQRKTGKDQFLEFSLNARYVLPLEARLPVESIKTKKEK